MNSNAISLIDIIGSSNIAAVGYDENSHTLAVQFWRRKGEKREKGNVYYYLDVPLSEYAGMLKAESMGQYFSSHIRGQYETEKSEQTDE